MSPGAAASHDRGSFEREHHVRQQSVQVDRIQLVAGIEFALHDAHEIDLLPDGGGFSQFGVDASQLRMRVGVGRVGGDGLLGVGFGGVPTVEALFDDRHESERRRVLGVLRELRLGKHAGAFPMVPVDQFLNRMADSPERFRVRQYTREAEARPKAKT